MYRCLRYTLVAAAFAVITVAKTRADTAESCFENWSDAAPVVARERLLPARDIQQMARRQSLGDVVRLTLCRSGSIYVYRIVLRDERGRISNHTIDARAP